MVAFHPQEGTSLSTRELYIGIMSGTSLDAIDAVLVDFARGHRLLATHRHPMPAALRADLDRVIESQSLPLARWGDLDHALGQCYADAALELLNIAGIDPEEVQAVGVHGQTVYHRPYGPAPFTLQLGDPNCIAERTGINTVADFRRRDLAAGGQGAPLVPAFHATLFAERAPCVVVNLGGIANITILPGGQAPVTGFDTGPGNTLLDQWNQRYQGSPFDDGGRWGAGGAVHDGLLAVLLQDPYFAMPPPKSTGREYFNLGWLHGRLSQLHEEIRVRDVQATLAELTARTVAGSIVGHADIGAPCPVILCGGGAHNDDLRARFERRLPGFPVMSSHAFGIDPDWVEATAFAWLARARLAGIPGNLPAVTGARRPVVLGGLYRGAPGADFLPAGIGPAPAAEMDMTPAEGRGDAPPLPAAVAATARGG